MQTPTLVVLVDAADNEVGVMEKLRAHEEGALHRAVSVVLRRPDGALLLQRRAAGKYHSPGRWSNTACTHPRPGEPALEAAHRCLREEMGIEGVPLRPAGTVLYRARVSPSLEEHELDHLFVGEFGDAPRPSAVEVSEWGWTPAARALEEAEGEPERFTAWLPVVLRAVLEGDRSFPVLPPPATR